MVTSQFAETNNLKIREELFVVPIIRNFKDSVTISIYRDYNNSSSHYNCSRTGMEGIACITNCYDAPHLMHEFFC